MGRTSWPRVVAGLLAVSMIAAACSKPRENAKAPASTTTSEIEAPVTPSTEAATTTTAAKGAAARRRTTTTPRLTGGLDDAQARAVGALIKPQSTARKKPYYLGVGEDTIQLDFSTDPTNCGVAVVNVITAAGGALPTSTRFYRNAPHDTQTVTAEVNESIRVMVDYWNSHAFEAASYAPAIRNLMGNDATHQFFGRKLVAKIIDGGSNQCPDKTTAAAGNAANDDHAFVVFNNLEGASPAGAYNMAAALHAQDSGNPACNTGVAGCKRPMHFGTLWLSDQDYTKFAPFSWTQFATGSTVMRAHASYICSKLVGGNATRSPDAGLQVKKRVFGLVHTNLKQDERLVEEFKGYLDTYCAGKGGRNILAPGGEVEYDGTDFTAAQQNNTNLIVQLQTAGVTSVIMITEPVQPLLQLGTARGQGFKPEWIWSSFGYADSTTVQRLYDDEEVKGSFGTSNLGVYGGFGFGAGDPFLMYHSSHLIAPDGKPCDPSSPEGMTHDDPVADKQDGPIGKYCKAPTALVTWYYTMLPFIGGILFAGPDLTPANVSAGLQAYPSTRYGGNGPTSDPRPALVGAGPGKYGFIVDAVEWRWRPDFTSPQPENKAQWVEYPDCMRHYITWPDKVAPNWEVNGPNWNAWCGDKNGYPHVLPEDSTH